MFARIRANAAKAERIQATRLASDEELLAERIKKLLFSASFYNGRDQRAYDNLCKEMKQVGDKLRAQGGRERWMRVRNRVQALCEEHWVGLSQYIYLLGDPPESGQ